MGIEKAPDGYQPSKRRAEDVGWHTFATSGLRGGMPLDKLQALMGHAKPETTLIYAKLDQTDLQREHSRIYA